MLDLDALKNRVSRNLGKKRETTMMINFLGYRVEITTTRVFHVTYSIGVNAKIMLEDDKKEGYTATTFPKTGVSGLASQTLQSDFHGHKLSASANYEGYYIPSGGGDPVTVYASQPNGHAADVILQGVFVGGFNAQPLPPGTDLSDGGISLAAFPPNGLGNGIDMLPGKPGQTVKCPLHIMPSCMSLFAVPPGATLHIRSATIFLTFFADNTYRPIAGLNLSVKRRRF